MVLVCIVSQNCVTAGEVEGSSAERGSINKLSMGISPLAMGYDRSSRTDFKCLVKMDN